MMKSKTIAKGKCFGSLARQRDSLVIMLHHQVKKILILKIITFKNEKRKFLNRLENLVCQINELKRWFIAYTPFQWPFLDNFFIYWGDHIPCYMPTNWQLKKRAMIKPRKLWRKIARNVHFKVALQGYSTHKSYYEMNVEKALDLNFHVVMNLSTEIVFLR